jgi:hypothetical protein
MWPQDILQKLVNPHEDAMGQLDYRYDEFGFKVKKEDGPEENFSKLLSTPFVEDAQQWLRWTAYSAHSQQSSWRVDSGQGWKSFTTFWEAAPDGEARHSTFRQTTDLDEDENIWSTGEEIKSGHEL